MGEAKRRGTYDERVVASIMKRQEERAVQEAAREAREIAWNEKQAERRRLRLEEEEAMRAKTKVTQHVEQTRQVRPRGALAVALALSCATSALPSR